MIGIKDIKGLKVWPVETNIIIAEILDSSKNTTALKELLKQKGLLISPYVVLSFLFRCSWSLPLLVNIIFRIGSQIFRITTHYEISKKDSQKIVSLLHEAFEEMK